MPFKTNGDSLFLRRIRDRAGLNRSNLHSRVSTPDAQRVHRSVHFPSVFILLRQNIQKSTLFRSILDLFRLSVDRQLQSGSV